MNNPIWYFVFFFFLIVLLHYCNKIIQFTSIVEVNQLSQLDGLRGILSISVVFHHSLIMYNYFLIDKWVLPFSSFYILLGQVSVSVFFMITGFLFGLKLFNKDFNTLLFLKSRVKRIIPLQIFSVIISFFVILLIDNFVLYTSLADLIVVFLKWFSYGYLEQPLINNNFYSCVIETVYWTLQNEWLFYLSLPFLFLIRKKIFQSNNKYFIITLFILFLINRNNFVLLFFIGIFIAYLKISNIQGDKYILLIVSSISLLVIFVVYDGAYHRTVAILLGVIFFSIVNGVFLYSFLQNKILQFLGQISYSIYLLHNIVVFILFYFVHTYCKAIIDISLFEYLMILFAILSLTILLSFFTYKFIEHKFYFRRIKK